MKTTAETTAPLTTALKEHVVTLYKQGCVRDARTTATILSRWYRTALTADTVRAWGAGVKCEAADTTRRIAREALELARAHDPGRTARRIR